MNFAELLHSLIPREKTAGGSNQNDGDNQDNSAGLETANRFKDRKLILFKLSVKRPPHTQTKLVKKSTEQTKND